MIQVQEMIDMYVHVTVCMVVLCSRHELVFGVSHGSVVFSVLPSRSG